MISLRSLAAGLAVLMCLAPGAYAFNTQFLDDAPISRLNDEDIKIMLQTVDDALDNGDDGAEVEWRNEHTGNHGSVTPLDSTTIDGRICRHAVFKTFADHLSSSTRYRLCKTDGAWRVTTP